MLQYIDHSEHFFFDFFSFISYYADKAYFAFTVGRAVAH